MLRLIRARGTIAIAALTVSLVWLVAPASTQAQSWEVSGLVGYTPSVELEQQSPQVDDLSLRGGVTFGVQGGWHGPRWGVEVSWMRHLSALEIETSDGTADLFDFEADQLLGNFIFDFGRRSARLHPFLLAGVGATFFRADEPQTETKLSFGFGGGIKYFLSDSIGIHGQFRYKPTMLDDEKSAPFCDPFGFCQNWLHQIEMAGGIVVRF